MVKIRVARHVVDQAKMAMVELAASVNGGNEEKKFFSLGVINNSQKDVFKWLGDIGIAMVPDARQELKEALAKIPAATPGVIATVPGWCGSTFVSHAVTAGAGNVISALGNEDQSRWTAKETLEKWQEKIAKPIARHPVGVFLMCVGLAGPVVRFTNHSSICVLLSGVTTQGKTTMQRLTGSCWGGGGDREFIESFSKSPQAFEQAARRGRDSVLILDEYRLLHADPVVAAKQFGLLLFGLHSPMPRERFGDPTSSEDLRGTRLMSSNPTVAELLRLGGIRYEAQEAVRVLELQIHPTEFSAFRFKTKDAAKRARFVGRYSRRARKYCGEAGRTFVTRLVDELGRNQRALQSRIDRYVLEVMGWLALPESATAVELRLAEQVAIVGAAGRLASRFGVLPYKKATLKKAMRACWARIREKTLQSLGRDPVLMFMQNLQQAVPQLTVLAGKRQTAANARPAVGYVKHGKSGKSEFCLTTAGFSSLTAEEELVLRWLERRGLLHRDSKKRQTKVVIGRDKKGNPVRVRLYKIVCDADPTRELEQA